jgi:hypothetical protein
MTYRELITKYENDLNILNKAFLDKVKASEKFIELADSANLEQQQKTIQFHLYSLTKEFNEEIKNKIENIKSDYGEKLDDEVQTDK